MSVAISMDIEDCLRRMTQCAVCMVTMSHPQALTCLHSFCKKCIELVMDNDTVRCPQCRAVTHVTDIKNDFKTRELCDALSVHRYSLIRPELAARDFKLYTDQWRHLLLITKNELEESLKNAKQTNNTFENVAIEKVREAKRMWVLAFGKGLKYIEKEIHERVRSDSVAKSLQEAIDTVDSKLKAVTSSAGDQDEVVDQAFATSMKEISALLSSIPKPSSGHAARVWQDWDVTSSQRRVAQAVDFLLNPVSREVLSRINFQNLHLPNVVAERSGELGYRPFIDPRDPYYVCRHTDFESVLHNRPR